MFDYLNYTNTIPLEKFQVGKVPQLNPISAQYKTYWKQQKRRCVEGNWVEHEGAWRWMPGPLYFYTNFWYIEAKKRGSAQKGKSRLKPMLRDVEWIKFYVNAAIRGFSGFTNDPQYSCSRLLKDAALALDEVANLPETEEYKKAHLYKPDGTLKEYVPVLEYLYAAKGEDLGKPLYQNHCLNLCDLEARGGGKSYTFAALCAHNFLFDGAQDYDAYLDGIKNGEPMSSQTLIGAIDTKYTSGLYDKFFYGLDNLEGGITINGRAYPSPLSKQTSGQHIKTLTQEYEEKRGGQWVTAGSKSKLHHRTFKDNPFAANGTRPTYAAVDEIGFHYNITECLGQLKECTYDGATKDGSVHMGGTGGDMDGGSTEAVKKVFYDPDAYDCLAFDDIFEDTGNKIGFFFPAYMTLNDFKDILGNTNRAAAIAYLRREREKLKKGKSKKPYEDELQQRPLVPSEVFLLSEGNIFPAAELREHLGFLETCTDKDVNGQVGELVMTAEGIAWEPDLKGALRACDYPILKASDHIEGAIQIWEHPKAGIPYGLYVGGCDPYAQDEESKNSESLGSVFIIKRACLGYDSVDKVVAEYTARPHSMKTFHENVRKLIMYYNGELLYENNILGLKAYFENAKSLKYLAYTPTILKANHSSSVSRTYGQHMTVPVKDELELATRDWLLEPAGEPDEHGHVRLNLHNICSVPLIKELLAYNDHGNFDRVIALMLAICQKLQLQRINVVKKEALKRDNFFSRKFNGGN